MYKRKVAKRTGNGCAASVVENVIPRTAELSTIDPVKTAVGPIKFVAQKGPDLIKES